VDEVVAARLRSVLTEAAPAAVPEPDVGSLSAVGSPLSWSDIIPGWPDDVDLDPDSGPPEAEPPPAPSSPGVAPSTASVTISPASASLAGVSALDVASDAGDLSAAGGQVGALRQPTGGFPAASAWATPPLAMAAEIDLGEPFLASAPGPGIEESGRLPLPRPPWTLPDPRRVKK